MTRDGLVTAVADATHLPRKTVEEILKACLEHIAQALRQGEEVSLVSFGQFAVGVRRSRRGVNPRRPSEAIRIPAVKVVKFRAGKRLKETVRQ